MKKVLVISSIPILVLAGLFISSAIAAEKKEESHKETMEAMKRQQELIIQRLKMLETMSNTAFSPKSAAMISLGELRDKLGLELEDRIEIFEELLKQVKHLGVRNSIRMTLKDLYVETEQNDKAVELLEHMILENDEMLTIEEEYEAKRRTRSKSSKATMSR